MCVPRRKLCFVEQPEEQLRAWKPREKFWVCCWLQLIQLFPVAVSILLGILSRKDKVVEKCLELGEIK